MARSAAEHVVSAAEPALPAEAQHDVLRSAGDLADVVERPVTEILLRHPRGHLRQVVGQIWCQSIHAGEATSRLFGETL
jgi:hypothetical protein